VTDAAPIESRAQKEILRVIRENPVGLTQLRIRQLLPFLNTATAKSAVAALLLRSDIVADFSESGELVYRLVNALAVEEKTPPAASTGVESAPLQPPSEVAHTIAVSDAQAFPKSSEQSVIDVPPLRRPGRPASPRAAGLPRASTRVTPTRSVTRVMDGSMSDDLPQVCVNFGTGVLVISAGDDAIKIDNLGAAEHLHHQLQQAITALGALDGR
jgi:hypothetical protein